VTSFVSAHSPLTAAPRFRTMACLLILAGAFFTACGDAEVCTDVACAALTADQSNTGKVSICKKPSGCDGCYYQRLLDQNGTKIRECQDAADAKCDTFIERDATDYCAMGSFCRPAGSQCSNDAMCCARRCDEDSHCF
jgi:hypothetical protein